VDQLQPGTAWTLRNAKVDMYRGCMRLAVDQFGKLEPSENSGIQPKVSGFVDAASVPVICHVLKARRGRWSQTIVILCCTRLCT
jgi:hypothetical protein